MLAILHLSYQIFGGNIMNRIFLILMVWYSLPGYSYNWDVIADSIAAAQSKVTSHWYAGSINTFKYTRKTEGHISFFDSVSCVGDTLFFLEDHVYMKPTKLTTFWVKNNPASFTTYGFSDVLNHDMEFCPYDGFDSLKDLCERWDTLSIRRLEKERAIFYDSKEIFIMATRLILRPDEKFSVDCIFFREFRWEIKREEEHYKRYLDRIKNHGRLLIGSSSLQ